MEPSNDTKKQLKTDDINYYKKYYEKNKNKYLENYKNNKTKILNLQKQARLNIKDELKQISEEKRLNRKYKIINDILEMTKKYNRDDLEKMENFELSIIKATIKKCNHAPIKNEVETVKQNKKVIESKLCSTCNKHYKNKSTHEKSKYHLLNKEIKDTIKNI
jgi:hypothetical protein